MTTYLRDYQEQARDSMLAALCSDNARSALMVLPTGTGKTETMLDIMDQWPDKNCGILYLAHKVELVEQPFYRWIKKTGEFPEIIQGERGRTFPRRSRVFFASKDTLHPGRIKSEFPDPMAIGLIIVDEAHHAVSTSRSYQHILDYFSVNPNLRIAGMTATPDRADEVALATVFETVAYEYPLFDINGPSAIGDGWLAPLQQQFVVVESLKYESVTKNRNDFADASLAEMLKQTHSLERMVNGTIATAGQRSTFAFFPDVDSAVHAATICSVERPGSACVVASRTSSSAPGNLSYFALSSDLERRMRFIELFSRGEVQYMCNVGVFTEGTDVPVASCASVCRPTKSRSLYAQMVGRVMRVLPDVIEGVRDGQYWRLGTVEERKAAIANSAKPNALILDFVGASKHSLTISSLDLLGGKFPDSVVGAAKARISNGSGPVDPVKTLEAQLHDEEVMKKRKMLRAIVTTHTRIVDPFSVLDIPPVREPGWHKGRKPTPKMKQALERFRVPRTDIEKMRFVDARAVLDMLIRNARNDKATYNQRKILLKHNFDPNVSFQSARHTIDRIAQSGWKLMGNYSNTLE